MSYSIKFEEREEYLYAYIEGQDSLEASLECWQKIADRTDEKNYKKLLVEENLEGQLGDIDMFAFATQLTKMGLIDVKIAFVDQKADHNEGNEFAELVATNRGIKGKIFIDIDKAQKWLLAGK